MEEAEQNLPNENANVVQELLDENERLRMLLTQRAAAMEMMHRNYVHLNLEYKALQGDTYMIQRKAERLAKLNAEQDLELSAFYQKQNRRNANKCGRKGVKKNHDRGRATGKGNDKNKEGECM